jgi:hypothetical protein
MAHVNAISCAYLQAFFVLPRGRIGPARSTNGIGVAGAWGLPGVPAHCLYLGKEDHKFI